MWWFDGLALRLFVEAEMEQHELGEDEFRHRFEWLIPLPPLTFFERRLEELVESWPMFALTFWPFIHEHDAEDSDAFEDLNEHTLEYQIIQSVFMSLQLKKMPPKVLVRFACTIRLYYFYNVFKNVFKCIIIKYYSNIWISKW